MTLPWRLTKKITDNSPCNVHSEVLLPHLLFQAFYSVFVCFVRNTTQRRLLFSIVFLGEKKKHLDGESKRLDWVSSLSERGALLERAWKSSCCLHSSQSMIAPVCHRGRSELITVASDPSAEGETKEEKNNLSKNIQHQCKIFSKKKKKRNACVKTQTRTGRLLNTIITIINNNISSSKS